MATKDGKSYQCIQDALSTEFRWVSELLMHYAYLDSYFPVVWCQLRYFVKQVQNTFDSKKTLRLKREDADLKRLELWISNDVEKRAWDSSKHLLHRINGTLNTRSLPQVVFFVKLYIYVCVCVLLCPSMISSVHWGLKKAVKWTVSLSARKALHHNNPVPSMSTGQKQNRYLNDLSLDGDMFCISC